MEKYNYDPIEFKIPNTEVIIPIIMIANKEKDNRGNWVELPPKPYMQVPQRLVWFNIEKPDWTIDTEIVKEWKVDGEDDKGKYQQQLITYRCSIWSPDEKTFRSATKTKLIKSAKDYDSCETGAIGRCLAMLGYGTAYAQQDMEEDEVVDSPTGLQKTEAKPQGLIPPIAQDDLPDFYVIPFGPHKGKDLKDMTTKDIVSALKWAQEVKKFDEFQIAAKTYLEGLALNEQEKIPF